MTGAVFASLVPLVVASGFFVGRSSASRRIFAFAVVGGGVAAALIGVYLLTFGALVAAERDTLGGALKHAVFGAALPEEALKVVFLFLILSREGRRGRVTPLTAVFAGMVTGLGFAAVENVFYALMGSFKVDTVRLITAMPCHACLGAVAGFYLAHARQGGGPWALVKAGLVPVLAHSLYNLPLMLDLAPMPWTSPGDDLMLTCMTLLWLATWTRMLLVRLRPLSAFSPE